MYIQEEALQMHTNRDTRFVTCNNKSDLQTHPRSLVSV